MAADEDEAKTLAALKIQARGRGMITRKQDRQALAQCSSPNRKEEARQERQRQLAERRARVEQDKPRTAGGLHAMCPDGNLGLADIQEALEDLGRSADGSSVVFRSVGLSGREISNMSALSAFVHLQRVDVSHNALESLHVLQHVPNLVYLDASHNRLTTVLDFRLPPPNAYALPAVSALREANLSCNNIAVIDDLSHHPNLSVLDLSDNHIAHISGVDSLRLLLCLNLDHNAITSVDGIPALSVKELGLGSNELSSLRGLSHCVHMEVLRAACNGIDSLAGLESMKCLRVLDVSDNKLKSIEDVEAVCGHGNLSMLQLEDNACSLVKCWRLKLLHRMPWIESLDGIDVLAEELVASRNFHDPQHPQYLDESRQDSVDIHPRRFEPGICARKFLEDAQQGVVQEEEEEQVQEEEEQVVDAEGE